MRVSIVVADWKVHERGDGVVAFQNEQHPGKWLRIKDGETNVGVSSKLRCVYSL